MSVYALTYTYGGPSEILAEHRPAHRAFLREPQERGVNLASGPLGDDGALIVPRGQRRARGADHPGGPPGGPRCGDRARGPRVVRDHRSRGLGLNARPRAEGHPGRRVRWDTRAPRAVTGHRSCGTPTSAHPVPTTTLGWIPRGRAPPRPRPREVS